MRGVQSAHGVRALPPRKVPVNKKFCSFCKIHCYKPDMRERIKDVMKWAGPRMIFTHPVFAFRHVFQMISYKQKLRKEAKAKVNV